MASPPFSLGVRWRGRCRGAIVVVAAGQMPPGTGHGAQAGAAEQQSDEYPDEAPVGATVPVAAHAAPDAGAGQEQPEQADPEAGGEGGGIARQLVVRGVHRLARVWFGGGI